MPWRVLYLAGDQVEHAGAPVSVVCKATAIAKPAESADFDDV